MKIQYSKYLYWLVLLLSSMNCQAQQEDFEAKQKEIGGLCQGCEAIYEYGDRVLTTIDTLPLFETSHPKIKISGIVYQNDGKTPAQDVILYIYHTNRAGIYEKKGNEVGWAKRHGFIRGWVKTNETGHYTFFTFRPASYPDRDIAEHIHITVKEPNKNEYYLDDFVFDDDPLLTKAERGKLKNRGGSGIVNPVWKDGIWEFHRNIILSLNIPDY